MQKTYSRINWENYPSGSTPINESNLNRMDVAINAIDDRVIQFDTTKLDKTSANGLLKGFSLNEESGVITLTYYDGSTQTISSNMAKIAVNVSYDTEMQCLVLTMPDGTVSYVDMTELITMYEFTASDTIYFEIDFNGNVSAKIKNNSITEAHLQTNYLANIKVETANSAQNREVAEASAILAKDYAEQAKESAEQALSTTPDGYNQMVEDVDLLKNAIIQTTDRTLYGSNAGGIKLIGIGGASEQGENPSPDNPQEIESVGDLKNLLDTSKLPTTTKYGVTLTNLGKGGLLIDGTPSSGGIVVSYSYSREDTLKLLRGAGDYILTDAGCSGGWVYCKYGTAEANYKSSTLTITKENLENEAYCMTIGFYVSGDLIDMDNVRLYPMLRKASVSNAEYKPYGYSLGIKASGKNLAHGNYSAMYVDNDTKLVTASTYFRALLIKVKPNTSYLLGRTGGTSHATVGFFDKIPKNGDTVPNVEYLGSASTISITTLGDTKYILWYHDSTASTATEVFCYETTDTTAEYEPYRSKSITIPLSEPLREGDEIAVVDGVWGVNRRAKVRVIDGTNVVKNDGTDNSNYLYYLRTSDSSMDGVKKLTTVGFCESLSHRSVNELYALGNDGFNTDQSENTIYINLSSYVVENTISAMKAYLAENPIPIQYELATPTFEPFTDQTPFYGLESFDTVTYISTDSEVEPSIELKFAKTEGDAINLGNYNRTKLNEIRISELMALQTELAAAVVAGSEG